MTREATLPERMRALANMPVGEHHAEELRRRADQLDAFIAKRPASPQADARTLRNLLAAWAGARLLYCKITGEPLV